jgi:hypothetical protein
VLVADYSEGVRVFEAGWCGVFRALVQVLILEHRCVPLDHAQTLEYLSVLQDYPTLPLL